jgi:phosphoribosylformylglycinamidine (FGAM) synthase-like enzyme
MRAWEILLSESQERMLVVVKKGREKEVKAIFEKWDLNCVEIGTVTEGNTCATSCTESLVAEVPAESLVLGGGAPVYDALHEGAGLLPGEQKVQAFGSARTG